MLIFIYGSLEQKESGLFYRFARLNTNVIFWIYIFILTYFVRIFSVYFLASNVISQAQRGIRSCKRIKLRARIITMITPARARTRRRINKVAFTSILLLIEGLL